MAHCTEAEALAWLVEGGLDAENKAVGCLYRKLLAAFRPWVYARNGSNDDAHDAVTEALVTFVRNFREGKYRDMGKLEHLLFRIAQRRFFDLLRNRGAAVTLDPQLPDIPETYDPFESAEAEAAALAQHIKLAGCLEKIGERCKERLVRFWYMRQSHEEIAAAMGDSSASVSKVMKNKCQDKLEHCIKDA